ncbi:MAG: response regulator transcription factor [Bacteroidales bacterium]|jgi:two-component system alkaline phosphatase synthesis response regulator PhoP|nr:response regulator transcription factor [Bacteroidales bacterium]
MENKYKLLLVDDDPDILEFLSYSLRKEGYEVFTASDGNTGISIALKELPHLVLLDVMMPGKDGVETCEEIRSHRELDATIIAFLTARAEDYSQIAGFEAGADDYIPKPIRPKVLQARIKALLKRNRIVAEKSEADTGDTSRYVDIVIDTESYVVIRNGEHITLPRKEFELLSLLMSKPEKVFDREEIYHTVWGGNSVVGDRTIDVHIRKLREKIGDNRIRTLKGIGYKYVSVSSYR